MIVSFLKSVGVILLGCFFSVVVRVSNVCELKLTMLLSRFLVVIMLEMIVVLDEFML